MTVGAFFEASQKILGMNARNLKFIQRLNHPNSMRLVDSKLKTKRALHLKGLPTPKTYAVVKDRGSLATLAWQELPTSFVLKPNRGLGGAGIKIFYSQLKDRSCWVGTDAPQTISQISNHVLRILDGDYSLSGRPDWAFFEERVRLATFFKHYTFKGGVPDVRVIVYERVPVMAMVRLPTKESGGRANLALGAIGVGVDMGRGLTTSAVHYNTPVDYIPHTRHILRGLNIPRWSEILELAVDAQMVSGLGFAGVDVALDRERGPVILELNARPGLKIQLANLAPLGERIERVKGLKVKTAKKGVKVGMELFGDEGAEEVTHAVGRRIIGIFEHVTVMGIGDKKTAIRAKIDTGAYRSSLDATVAKSLGIDAPVIEHREVKSALGEDEARPIVRARFILGNEVVESEVSLADRSQLKHALIIGRRDLGRFLIDPRRRTTIESGS